MSTGGSDGRLAPRRLKVTSEVANIAQIRAAVSQMAEAAGFCAEDVSAIALAADEAVANVIRHGYEGCSGQPIEVAIEMTRRGGGSALQITICDCGRQVDPLSIVGRDLEDLRPGGLGTHIIKTVMDEVEYTHRQPRGMQLRLLKKLDSRPAGGDAGCGSAEERADGR